jgi:hypothetical protein
MLEHLSPKFKMPPMEREPRAALVLNRFTRNLSIMFATSSVVSILGLRPDQLQEKPFYDYIQEDCQQAAEECLETAKANESIAYLRFWFKDPRTDEDEEENEEDEEEDGEDGERDVVIKRESSAGSGGGWPVGDSMDIDDNAAIENTIDSAVLASRVSGQTRRRQGPRPSFELEAVVSCTSDGLVVVLRKARPRIPDAHPPLLASGLCAAPWGQDPILPQYPPELYHQFRPPLRPQFMPLREEVKAAGGLPADRMYMLLAFEPLFPCLSSSGTNNSPETCIPGNFLPGLL